jgi:prepilin-type N-terminal cleavage/methylation domain-containing protein
VIARLRKLSLLQRGDTIIEVLIAVAVVSSVLGITYAAMNRNMLIIRSSQERTEAVKLLQGQIEALRQMSIASPSLLPAANVNFCMKADGSAPTVISGSPVALDADNWANYIGVCTSNSLYHTVITTTDGATYKFYARWDRLGGNGRDEIIMVYKI